MQNIEAISLPRLSYAKKTKKHASFFSSAEYFASVYQ